MKILVMEQTSNLRRNKARLERELSVEIFLRGKTAQISGKEEDEYIALKVLEALSFGFPVEEALYLKDLDFLLEKVSLKSRGEKKRLEQIRGRIIGKHGRTREVLEELADCFIVVHGNEVGVIARADSMRNVLSAIDIIAGGRKQSQAYTFLEKANKKKKQEELELKREF